MIDSARYRQRQQKTFNYLLERDLQVGVIVDLEGSRNRSLRYLCGHPDDGLLFLFAEGRSLLVPWDVPLARALAAADELVSFETYDRSLFSCIKTVLAEREVERAELTGFLSFPLVRALQTALPGVVIRCGDDGIDEAIEALRMVKDPEEIGLLRRACEISDVLIQTISSLFDGKQNVTEIDLALFLEAEARRRGAEGMGFDTLAASPGRSYAIHSFPRITAEPIGTRGLSILDFGVSFAGYTSDVTLTLVKAPLKPKEQILIESVQAAYDLARSLCRPGVDPVVVGQRVQEYFQKGGFHMPHSLGHGIGLDAHEAPLFRRSRPIGIGEQAQLLQPGMVFTLEPGLYDPQTGGARLENDFLCTDSGIEVLTSARILYL